MLLWNLYCNRYEISHDKLAWQYIYTRTHCMLERRQSVISGDWFFIITSECAFRAPTVRVKYSPQRQFVNAALLVEAAQVEWGLKSDTSTPTFATTFWIHCVIVSCIAAWWGECIIRISLGKTLVCSKYSVKTVCIHPVWHVSAAVEAHRAKPAAPQQSGEAPGWPGGSSIEIKVGSVLLLWQTNIERNCTKKS